MKKQKLVAVLSLSVIGVAGAAGIYPNPHLVNRVLDGAADKTVSGAVNAGTLWKEGAGTTTFSAPSFASTANLQVQDGGVVLDLDAVPTVPTLPDALKAKASLWLDATKNVVVDGDSGAFVEAWFDCRETDVTAVTKTYPYAESNVRRGVVTDALYTSERRPGYIATDATFGRAVVSFGSYSQTDSRWLLVQNSGNDATWSPLSARDVFAVVARDNSGGYGHLLNLGLNTSQRGSPLWTTANNFVWGDTQNTRMDKAVFFFDRQPQEPSRFQVPDTDWHLLSARLLTNDAGCQFNQIGLERDFPQSSGGFKMAEMIVFEKRLTDFDRMRVEDYLWKKWFGAKQTAIGRLSLNTNTVAEVRSASDVSGTLSGSGTFVQNGTGCTTVVADGFAGVVDLKAGAVRTDAARFVLAEGGQKITVGSAGNAVRSTGAIGQVEKAGSGILAVAAVSNDVKTLKVSAGTLRLAPEEEEEPLPGVADFPNANFEDFASKYPNVSSYNVGGGSDTGIAYTNENWVFSRVGRAGGNLVMLLANSDGTFSGGFNKTDGVGLGFDGNYRIYICRGSATGAFRIAAPGLYRLQMSVVARQSYENRDMQILVDGQFCSYVTAFTSTEFKRFEVEMPWLAAGEHTVTISDVNPANAQCFIFDDLKVVPARAAAEAPIRVAVANPSFEEPNTAVMGVGLTFKPQVANCTGWTVPDEPDYSNYVSGQLPRCWFDAQGDTLGVAAYDNAYTMGHVAYPAEMPQGFLCAQVLGKGAFTQMIDFPAAGRYRIRFALAKRPVQVIQTVRVSVGDQVVKRALVSHAEFRTYTADFDIAEAGSRALTFAGEVDRYYYRDTYGNADTTLNGTQMEAAAYLDDISIERVGDVRSGNLLVNGDFESRDGWTLHVDADYAVGGKYGNGCWEYNMASKIGKETAWPCFHAHAPISGTNSLVLSKWSALRQKVTLAAGRYELTFRQEVELGLPNRIDCQANLWVGVTPGDVAADSVYDRFFDEALLHTSAIRERKAFFTISEPGAYTLEFHTDVSAQEVSMGVMIDDVFLRRVDAPTTPRDYSAAIPTDLAIAVTGSGRLNLDFDGRACISELRHDGRSCAGVISHQRYPEWVFGRGELYAAPKGTLFLFR